MALESVAFRPYTGVIDPNSKRYQTAKAMVEEGKAQKSETQKKYEEQLEELRTLLRILGKDTSAIDEMMKLYKGDEELAIRNLMGRLDEDGDPINSYGVSGMDITGKDPSTIQKIIDIPEAARQDMFDTSLREFIRDYGGMGNGETDRTAVYTRYQRVNPATQKVAGFAFLSMCQTVGLEFFLYLFQQFCIVNQIPTCTS